ncbi:MAG: GNAT family N-acetyltransferase, partial [Candidatus Promineifilaceae bacterium]
MQTTASLEEKTFRLTAADPHAHLLPISQITADAFAGGQQVAEISQQYIGNCHYDWQTSRLIWDGDKLVTHWGVWGYPMRLGGELLKVAGVGAVVTLANYRQQGLMQTAALASFRAMQENGYDLSILRGRHYAKFGYVRAWNYVTYRLKPEELPRFALQSAYHLLGPGQMAAMDALYNQSHADFSGTAVRPTYPMLQASDRNAYGWFDDSGTLAGYVCAAPVDDQKTLQCVEAVGDPEQALAVLTDLLPQAPYETVAFYTLPQRHPILQIIRRGTCVVENKYFYHTGWQVRLVNLASTLGKIRPLLENRLQHSHLASWTGQLTLDAGEQKAGLGLANGRITLTDAATDEHAIHAGPTLARLLIGADDPTEIMQQENIHCTGLGADLAQVLFPN